MLISKIFFWKFIHEATSILKPLIAVIIIQVSSKTLRAKLQEVLKNANCKWSLRDCICSTFDLTNHLVNVSLKRRTDISIIKWHMTTEERARDVDMPQQGAGIHIAFVAHLLKLVPILNAGVKDAWQPENNSVQFVVNCKICQQETKFLNLLGTNGLFVVYQHLAVAYPRLLLPLL